MINLNVFNLKKIKPDSTILIIGRRRSGKSWVIRDIMYNLKDKLPAGVVFSATANINKFFDNFIPPAFIYDDVDLNVLDRVVSKQKEKCLKASKEKIDGRFVIMDDVLHDPSWTKDKSINFLLFNGRHASFFFILAIQYINSIPQKLMNNFDYVFAMNEASSKTRKKLYDSFCGSIGSYKDFDSIFKACVKDHGCMVIDTHGTDIDDSIFYFKSKERDGFKVGSKSFWKYSRKNLNEQILIDN